VPDPELTTAPPEAFARLFESVHEGVYIGTLSSTTAQTLSANPFLKLMFGYAAETPQEDVRPFELERFVDPQARDGFVERLQRDGAITDYLLRLRRADRSAFWVEVTAQAESTADGIRVEALMRDISCSRRKSLPRSVRRSPASPTS
jgi:PAS domain-containing protein